MNRTFILNTVLIKIQIEYKLELATVKSPTISVWSMEIGLILTVAAFRIYYGYPDARWNVKTYFENQGIKTYQADIDVLVFMP